jgi:predicted dehydrogenase
MRAAVVGAGLMGRWHARELRRAGGTVVGVCDRDAAAAASLARVHGGAAFESYDAMLAQVAADVVHVCTPSTSHVQLAERALRCGAHAIVEKPLAPTAAATEKLLAVADDCGRFVCPVHQYAFQRPIRAAGRTLERLGSMLDVSWVACSAGAAGRSADEADAVAADVLDHPLSVLQRLLGLDVAQLHWTASRPRPGELRAFAETSHASVSIAISMGGRPTRNELRVIATGGTLHADLFHGYSVVEPSAVSKLRKVSRPFALSAATTRAATVNLARRAVEREPAYPGLRTLIAEAYASARDGRRPPIGREECLAVARARDRIVTAAGA